MHNLVYSTIAFDSASKRHKDANGYLHIDDCPLTKAQVAPYFGREIPGWRDLGLEPERQYSVYRPAEELEKSLPLWRGLPVLLRHEADSAEQPQKDLRVGSVGTRPRFDGTYPRNDLEIQDARGIAVIEDNSQRQLSAGYRYTAVLENGEFEGVPYEIVMRDIHPNHIALVRKGRAGPDVMVEDSAPQGGAKPITSEDRFMKIKKVAQKVAQRATKLLTGKKLGMAMDTDPEAVAAQVAEVVEAVLEEEQKNDAPPAGTDNAEGGDGNGSEGNQAQDNDSAAKLKELLAPLLDGKTEIDGKPVDEFIAGLVAALATDNEPDANDEDEDGAKGGEDEEQAQDGMPKGLRPVRRKQQSGMAFDAAALAANVEKQVAGRFRAKEQAAQDVKPLVGVVSVMAFDSAEGIYSYALEKRGMNPAQYPQQAWRGIVKGMVDAHADAAQKAASSTMALDSKSDSPLAGIDTSRFSAV